MEKKNKEAPKNPLNTKYSKEDFEEYDPLDIQGVIPSDIDLTQNVGCVGKGYKKDSTGKPGNNNS